jgi:hypothetical protein
MLCVGVEDKHSTHPQPQFLPPMLIISERFSCYFLFGNEDVCLLHVGFHLASSAFVVACLIYTRAHCSTQNLLTCLQCIRKLYFLSFYAVNFLFFSGVLYWKWRKYSAMCNELYALLHEQFVVCEYNFGLEFL